MNTYAFSFMITSKGKPVTIKNYTQQTDSHGKLLRNSDNSITTVEEDVTTTCRILSNKGSEVAKMRFQGAPPTMEEADATGLFLLTDAQYLKKGNKVITNNIIPVTYEMLNPVEKETHFEVPLKRNDP